MLSCSLDDSSDNSSYLIVLPIENVYLPEYFEQGHSYQIDLTYLKTSTCYAFNDIFYDVEGNTITVAVFNNFYDNGDCQTVNLEVEKRQ